MKQNIIIGLLLGTLSAHKLDGIFELSKNRIMQEEAEKYQAEAMVEYEAEKQFDELEKEKVHEKHMVEAEDKARKLLENAEIEANMSSQQKLNTLMKLEDNQAGERGENIGFIKKFTAR